MTQEIGVHKCSEKDYEKFYPVSIGSKIKIDSFKKQNAFNCLDDLDIHGQRINKKLFGHTDNMANRNLVITFRPCIPVQLTPENENQTETMCLADYKN